MHQQPRFSTSHYFLYQVAQILFFVVVLHTSACSSCNQTTIPPLPAVDMAITEPLLIGHATEMVVIFRMSGPTSALDLKDLKLKVRVGEQKTLQGPATGSQVSYNDVQGNQQSFTDAVEKPLTAFTKVDVGGSQDPQEFKIYFWLAPAHGVVQAKIHFSLFNKSDEAIKNIEVEWIKGEMVISPLTKLEGSAAFFTLQNLQADIKDLRKISVSIPDAHKKVSFLVGGNKKTEATLAELLPHTSSIAKGQQTDPIKVVIDGSDGSNDAAVFSILVLATNKLPIDEEKVELYKPDHLSEELENIAQEMKKLEQKGKLTKEELAALQEHKKTLNKVVRNMLDRLKAEAKEIKANEKKALQKLEEEERQALIGKDDKEQHIIKEEYKRKRKEVHLESKLKLEYRNGFNNALKHNLFGIPLKHGKTAQYRQGQQAGHRISLVIGRTETAIGPTLVAVGISTTIAAGPPTLGGAAIGTIPTALTGFIILTHGIYVVERAQSNLDALKNR